MFVRPTPFDLRVNHALIGQATDPVEAALLNERLDALADWMVGEDETKWSLLWKQWLEIARPEQLPPQFDLNWREWKIDGPRDSGRTRAAAEFIVSQLGDTNLRVFAFGKTTLAAQEMVTMIHWRSDAGMAGKDGAHKIADVPIISRAIESVDHNMVLSNGMPTIVWLDDLLFPPSHISIGKFHSLIHGILRAPRTRVIWSG